MRLFPVGTPAEVREFFRAKAVPWEAGGGFLLFGSVDCQCCCIAVLLFVRKGNGLYNYEF